MSIADGSKSTTTLHDLLLARPSSEAPYQTESRDLHSNASKPGYITVGQRRGFCSNRRPRRGSVSVVVMILAMNLDWCRFRTREYYRRRLPCLGQDYARRLLGLLMQIMTSAGKHDFGKEGLSSHSSLPLTAMFLQQAFRDCRLV